MYCKNCGQQIDDNAVVCVHCGAQQQAVATAAVKPDVPALD